MNIIQKYETTSLKRNTLGTSFEKKKKSGFFATEINDLCFFVELQQHCVFLLRYHFYHFYLVIKLG